MSNGKVMVGRFTHSSKNKSFTAEASDFNEENLVGRPTITLVSDMGTTAEFFHNKIVRTEDEDNEILYWEYKPTSESVAANPRLKDYTLTIFND